MNFICCCRKISRLKKDKDSNNSFINSEVSKNNRTCNIFDSSEVSKNNRTCNIFDSSEVSKNNRTCNIFENITRTNSNLSIKSIDSKSNISDFSTDTISICSNSSLNDYIIAIDSIMTKQEYMNHQAPVCGHEIEQMIFNTNLL